MALTGHKTFVGFGFGPIQAGLFLYEAYRSGNFGRLVVAEVMPDVVEAVRSAGNSYWTNVAHFDGVDMSRVEPVELYLPDAEGDRARLVEAVAEADEVATALPSVRHYISEAPGSVHRILAEGLCRKAQTGKGRAVVYAAENHNHAAELLEEAVLGLVPAAERCSVREHACFLNTVIGKMSGVVSGHHELRTLGLVPVVLGLPRAFLVEPFNRILVSRPRFSGNAKPFERGLACFEEKDDLLPFEEAKLYGHNATHALCAYVGAVRGITRISELAEMPDILDFAYDAFVNESGEALIRKHRGIDPLFTPDGYRNYAVDLLHRMLNRFLNDTVERVGRDPERKLGWNDRLIGTIRMALQQGVLARRYAFGAVAALARLDREAVEGGGPVSGILEQLWQGETINSEERRQVLDLVEEARRVLLEFPAVRLTGPQHFHFDWRSQTHAC